ncbi:Response regulator receiver domain-containing protein [Mariprofundus ferrinatatus]|uniref:Response regulator receiver domain-containing protein n=1 Tax=Mariprofundus ferrinatatus TaxID=1921087 RepID=A0A2K8LAH6_9PROT|nr:Response regulator receiver domain-containing protein [Mariprofundus ferrinatatus]
MPKKSNKCHLLIIEDDTALAALLEEYLSAFDYDIQVINNGEAAIELLSRQHFDMVLSDIMLPGANGMTVLKAVGGDFVRTIVVLMTGYSGIEDALSAVKQGAYDFVSKPFQLPEMKIRLDNAANYQALLRKVQGEKNFDQANQKAEQRAAKIYRSLQAGGR